MCDSLQGGGFSPLPPPPPLSVMNRTTPTSPSKRKRSEPPLSMAVLHIARSRERRRILSPRMPRVAAAYAPHGEGGAPQHPEMPDDGDGVTRTRRFETA